MDLSEERSRDGALRRAIARARHYAPGAVAYFLVGGVAATVELSTFWVGLEYLKLPYVGAAVMAFVLATFVNYVLSSRLVFRSSGRGQTEEFLLVYLVSGIGFGINLAVTAVGIELLGTHAMFAKVMGTAAGFVFNYLARQFFIFDTTGHRLTGLLDASEERDDVKPAG